MKIVIATTRGFHLRHLARELIALGRDVTYFTYLPAFRIRRDGVPLARARSAFLRLLPWSAAALQRWSPRVTTAATEALFARADRLYARRLPPCDVFIGLSTLSVECARAARDRYGAKIILERGSRHILSQNEILAACGARPHGGAHVRRELEGYALADHIAVPSRHARDSFVERGFPAERLFQNPYGVEIDRFHPSAPPPGPFRLLFVGPWSRQKGCDALTALIEAQPDLRAVHVGTPGDAPFPATPNFRSLGPRDPQALRAEMARCHALALPSRQDGFGMVLTEALAAGLPVIASTMTGGPDLRERLDAKPMVSLVAPADARALAAAVRDLQREPRAGLSERDRAALSWAAYARRYDDFLQSLRRAA